MDRTRVLAQPPSKEHAREVAAQRAGEGAGPRACACAQRPIGGSGARGLAV